MIDLALSKNHPIVICKLKTVLNILCQSFAYTSAIVIINKFVNFINIGFLVVELVVTAMKIEYTYIIYSIYHYVPISQYTTII